jgi:copper chaperone CopZ
MKKISTLTLLSMLAAGAAWAETIEMKVHGMVCGFCAQGIEKSLRKHPATREVIVSLENKLVVVQTHEGQAIPDDALTKAIKDAGYDLKEISRSQRPIAEFRGQLRQAAK